MPARLLPLFPLQVVIFPRTRLPLHIFEDRYKEMVGDSIRDRSEFGIVLARESGIVNAGCTVVVDKVLQMHADGRMDIVTRGQRRFEIVTLDAEKDYLRAQVEYFEDEDTEPAAESLREDVMKRYELLNGLGVSPTYGEADLTDPQLSFQLAQGLPDLDFLSVLLRNRSEARRLHELNQYLTEYVPRRQTIARVREIAQTNGHGGKPAGM